MQLKRKDRQMNHEDSVQFLCETQFGILAMVDGKQPYAIPMNHFYENGRLYFHAATSGRKLDIIAANPEIAYTVAELQRLKPTENGLLCGFGAYYRSVICTGTAHLVTDAAQKALVLTQMTRHLAQEMAHQAPDVTPEQAASVAIICVDIHEISGKACLPE